MEYKSPKITADGLLFSDNKILLIKRKNDPFKGKWALPGGFVEYGEKVEDAAVREVLEETGLKTKIKDLFDVYSDPKRDPRCHIVTIVYTVESVGGKLKADDDAADARFFDIKNLPVLAFDHDKIINEFLRRLK